MNQKRKQLWLLAGGNGAGKSTFYQQFLKSRGLAFVNADLLAQQLDPQQPEKVSYEAAILVGKLRQQLLENGENFCFETVFSHPSKIDFMAQAKALGYEVTLIYIHLVNTELNQARVSQRVASGGHDVPADKITSRIPRTMKNIRDALPLSDIARFYDNSSFHRPFQSIAEIRQGNLQTFCDPLPQWAREVLR